MALVGAGAGAEFVGETLVGVSTKVVVELAAVLATKVVVELAGEFLADFLAKFSATGSLSNKRWYIVISRKKMHFPKSKS